MRKTIGSIVVAVVALGAAGAAGATGYPWRNHAAPYDFVFGNEIDTHQQTRKAADGDLAGFLYVHYTGETTSDGLPVAVHENCTMPMMTCDVGWTIDGVPVPALFLYHVPDDHPVWLVDRADIPQPGAYAHFHWQGIMPAVGDDASGYLLQLRAVGTFCFVHHAMAASGTCRDRGGVAVVPGIDIATHVNIVASFPTP
jgi:hypothetical protein